MLRRTLTLLWQLALSLIPTVIGGYLLYEKVILSIQNGYSHERAGTVLRAEEPVSFWMAVTVYSAGGLMILIFGLWCIWLVVKPR